VAILGTRDTHHRHQLPVRTRRKRAGSVFDRDLAQCSESGCGVFVVYSMSSGKKKLDANLGRFLFRQLVKVLLWRGNISAPVSRTRRHSDLRIPQTCVRRSRNSNPGSVIVFVGAKTISYRHEVHRKVSSLPHVLEKCPPLLLCVRSRPSGPFQPVLHVEHGQRTKTGH